MSGYAAQDFEIRFQQNYGAPSRSVRGFILLKHYEMEWVLSGKLNDDKLDRSAGCVPLKHLA
jgi:hypothetical protein